MNVAEGSLRGQRIAVLAANSHIGRQTIQSLTDHGASVAATARRDADVVALKAQFPHIDVYKADVTDMESLIPPVYHATGVLYLAARFGQSISDSQTMEVNVSGMENTVSVAESIGVRTLVNASSIAVYGDPRHQPQEEDGSVVLTEDSPTLSQTAYGKSKAITEELANGSEVPSVTNLRYAQLYGPETDAWSKKLLSQPSLYFLLMNRGVFHPVFIDDVVKANVAAFAPKEKRARQTINVAGNETSTWREMVVAHEWDNHELLVQLRALEILSIPLRGLAEQGLIAAGAVMDMITHLGVKVSASEEMFAELLTQNVRVDNTKLQKLIGAEAITPLRVGMAKTREWSSSQKSQLGGR